MEWAQANPTPAAPLQRNVLRDDVDNVDAIQDLSSLQIKILQG